MRLDGKVALVTGASRGIGRSIARRLAADGAHVIAHYGGSEAEIRTLAAEIETAGGKVTICQADLREIADIERMFADFPPELRLNILVNNAGGGSGLPRLEDVGVEDFEAVFALNTRAVMFVTQKAAAIMDDGGRIVSLSSGSTVAREPGLAPYAGSKAAIEAFTRVWATELAPRGITVNVISPGIVATELITQNIPEDLARQYADKIPLGRMGEPEDIADVVAFFASEDSRWVTGQNLPVNGGA